MGRADGIHWRTGAAPDGNDGGRDPILHTLIVGSPTVVNEPEARWHYAAINAMMPGGLVVWRSAPQSKPADRHWSVSRFAEDIFVNLDFHKDKNGSYPLDILLLNELNLNSERGDFEDDTDASLWGRRYSMLAGFLDNLLIECRKLAAARAFSPRFWFPAWAPGHGELTDDIAAIWVPVAGKFDGACLHAYESVENVTSTVEWYATRFPDKLLLLGEWNAVEAGKYSVEWEIRARLRSLCDQIPQLYATYFCWKWDGHEDAGVDIEGNAREIFWQDTPPVADGYKIPDSLKRLLEGSTEPETPPEPQVPTQPDPEPTEAPTEQTGGSPTVVVNPHGVDVSSWQHPNNAVIDWQAVAASGISFAVVKFTQGTYYVNPYAAGDWAGMKAAGLVRVAYHWGSGEDGRAESEAAYFLNAVLEEGLEVGDILVLDTEEGSGDVGAWATRFVRQLTALAGYRPMVYTGKWFADPHGFGDEPELAECGLWLAAYQGSIPEPIEPWASADAPVAIWQYSNAGWVPGIPGPVDMDLFNGTLDNLKLYGKPADAPVPPAEPAPPDGGGYEYVLGFANLVQRIGRDVVGEPMENEHSASIMGHSVNHQLTTHGQLIWWHEAGYGGFYPPHTM